LPHGRALVVDAVGVHLIGGPDNSRRERVWNSILEVSVKRVPAGPVTNTGVVLGLTDGSSVELVPTSATSSDDPQADPESAADEIRARLVVFRSGTL
jgi:hypothetical protein